MAREWPWPKEPTPPAQPNSPNWMARHPTRYALHADVGRVALSVFDLLGMKVRVNTYVKHPEYDFYRSWGDILGYSTQHRSFDTWGAGGRGAPVGREEGTRALMSIFRDPNPPWIAWCIWWGRIWTPDRRWRRFDDDGTGHHFDHPHITFFPGGMNLSLHFDTPSGLSLFHEQAVEELGDGWEDDREDGFWESRPDDGRRYQMADGIWVPV